MTRAECFTGLLRRPSAPRNDMTRGDILGTCRGSRLQVLGLPSQHRLFVIEQLLQRPMRVRRDRVLTQQFIERVTFGTQRMQTMAAVRFPPQLRAGLRFTFRGEFGQPVLIFGDDCAECVGDYIARKKKRDS